ncbi:MAG: hypothetical protein IIB57_12940 [Planctomycetes bacterium]|nr:hypothetical protein [Planctomycetota bacterium]
MNENVDKLMDRVSDVGSLLSGEEAARWFDLTGWKVWGLIVLVGLVVLIWFTRKIRRFLRRRRPPTLHPKLQKYGQSFAEPDPTLGAKRRKEAAEILATSSTGTIAGYEIVEQVEAIIVDGFRLAEDALEGLKAAAAMKGANAVINVHRDRVDGGTCSAAGDAVIVRRIASTESSEPVTGSS